MYKAVTANPRDNFKSFDEGKDNTFGDCKEVMLKDIAVCEDRMTQECGVCHTIHIKDCTITMKTVVTPVKVKKCMTKTRGDEMRDSVWLESGRHAGSGKAWLDGTLSFLVTILSGTRQDASPR